MTPTIIKKRGDLPSHKNHPTNLGCENGNFFFENTHTRERKENVDERKKNEEKIAHSLSLSLSLSLFFLFALTPTTTSTSTSGMAAFLRADARGAT